MKLLMYLISGFLLSPMADVTGQAMCYNENYDEVKHCDHGCCGTELDIECCLPPKLIPYTVAGVVFFVLLVASVVMICYQKWKALKRILESGNRPAITNDRTFSSHNITMVNNNSLQWSQCTMAPPPYIGPPPPYTAVSPAENLKETCDNLQQMNQTTPPFYSNSNIEDGCSVQHPQISQPYNEPPPGYGVYADLAHSH